MRLPMDAPPTAKVAVSADRITLGPMGCWRHDLATGRITWMDGTEELFGLPAGRFDGRFESLLQQIVPEDRPAVANAVRQAQQDRVAHEVQFRVAAADGSVRWIGARGRLVEDDRGEHPRLQYMGVDITAQKQAERSQREQGDLCTYALDAADMVAWEWNPKTDEVVRTGNLGRIIGQAVEQTRAAKDFLALIHPDDRERVLNALHRTETTGADYHEEFRLVRPDGRVVWVADQGRVTRWSNGAAACISGVIVDITPHKETENHLRQLEKELQEQTTQLQEADRRKDEFLAMLAHELRNPLAPIRNSVQVLRQMGFNDPTVRRVREMIDRQVDQLSKLVDDLLDVSRITQGRLQLQLQQIDLSPVVQSALETANALIQAQRHKVWLSLPTEPLMVHGDASRLEQVLVNLLNNAAKYMEPDGDIWVTAGQAAGDAVVRVRDRGAGIEPAMLDRIFDLFQQDTRLSDRSQGGLGIGLTLARRLIEMHGGAIQAFSEGPGTGSEFVLRVPLAPGFEKAERTDSGTAELPSLSCGPCKVLIVDDNADSVESLALLLQLWKHETKCAYDGPSALEIAREFQPDVVILDIGLPGMDGCEVARRLRKVPALAKTLLVAMTGFGQEDDQRWTLKIGFDHHLVKPIDAQALQRILSTRPERVRG